MKKDWPQVGPDTGRSEQRHGDCPATDAAAGLTGREHAAASLRAGEDGLRALYAAMDEGLVLHEIVHDRSGRAIDYRILDVNPAFERVTGITRARAVGALASELYGTGEAPYLDLYARVAASGKPEAFETDFAPMAKSFRISVFSPGPGQFATVFEDITSRRQAAEALKRERDLMQTVIDGARNSHLVLLDRDFNFVRVNAAYARTCGYRPEEMVGRNHFALYPDAENEAIFRRVRDTGEPVEFHDRPFVFPDQPERGVTYWEWTLIPVREASGAVSGLIFSLHETTARVRVEAALRENEARLETIVSKLPGVVLQYDRDLNLVTANEAARELLGVESLDVTRESIMTRLSARTIDGAPVRMEDLPTSRALRGEMVSGVLYRVRPPDGVERILSTSAVPLYKEGRISGVVALWYDVTEQRRLEELRDNLVHMVVHDMTSPLTALHLNVGLVRRSLGAEVGPDTERFLGQLERGIARLIRMTEDLLDASRLEAERLPLALEPCDLAELTCTAVEDARALAPGIEVRVGTPGPLTVRCDPSLVRRVVENLVSNALKHNPPDAAVEVRLSADATDARVTVRDRGEGIPPEYHEVIFAKFGTVEARRQHKYHSTGLGLTFCRLAIEAHGGRIGVDGKAGEGSTFWFTLPRG